MRFIARILAAAAVIAGFGISARVPAEASAAGHTPLPPLSGLGRRVVYDIGTMHVWLVDYDGSVVHDYPVSGHKGRTLPGTGEFWVFSRSRYTGVRETGGTFEYMVRFAWGGSTNLAIGFHSIPRRKDGTAVQTTGQLGTPQSHGCVRQKLSDAKRMWEFAKEGTIVDVVDTSRRARPAPQNRFPDGPKPAYALLPPGTMFPGFGLAL